MRSMYTAQIQTGDLNSPSSWGSSSQNIASAVLTPTSVELENDAPIANPSIKLWRPSPIMIIHATGAIFFFPTVSLPFSKESCVYKNHNINPFRPNSEKRKTIDSKIPFLAGAPSIPASEKQVYSDVTRNTTIASLSKDCGRFWYSDRKYFFATRQCLKSESLRYHDGYSGENIA